MIEIPVVSLEYHTPPLLDSKHWNRVSCSSQVKTKGSISKEKMNEALLIACLGLYQYLAMHYSLYWPHCPTCADLPPQTLRVPPPPPPSVPDQNIYRALIFRWAIHSRRYTKPSPSTGKPCINSLFFFTAPRKIARFSSCKSLGIETDACPPFV